MGHVVMIHRNTNAIEAEFTPILSAYVTSQYQQSQIINGEIISPVLWTQNLALLPNKITDLTLSKDGTGQYHLVVKTAKRP